MFLESVNSLPLWARQALLSLIAVFAAYLTGWFLSSVVCRRLSVWAEKTAWKWDEVLVETLRRHCRSVRKNHAPAHPRRARAR